MDSSKINKWIKVIASWFLLYSILTLIYYVAVQLSIIDERVSKVEHFQFFFGCLGNLFLFFGLWRISTWGWKAAVTFIPLSWVYYIFDIFIDYNQGMGMVLFFFALIDALILRFLFKQEVRDMFKLSSKLWIRVYWVVPMIFGIAVFFLTKDLFGDVIAIVLTLAVLLGFHQSNRIRKGRIGTINK